MIQRIQTVYLLLIASLMLALLFLPMATIQRTEGIYVFKALGGLIPQGNAPAVGSNWVLAIQAGVAVLLSILAIFSFKNRKLQAKLCLTLLAIIVILGASIYYFLIFQNQIQLQSGNCSVVIVAPIVALILGFLAIRGIRKDEKLIRSLDRLR